MVVKKKSKEETLVIAVSARALFNMDESNEIFLKKGLKSYIQHHKKHENKPLKQKLRCVFSSLLRFFFHATGRCC
jgi:hypothetical protein